MINLGSESEFVEFKKSTNELNEAMNSISAMLNKNGRGTIYFGVKNNGDAIGQQTSDNSLRDVSRKIYEDIKPTIYPFIHYLEGTPGVIVVEFSGQDKPYSSKGKFYMRTFDEDKQIDIKELLKIIFHTDTSNLIWEKLETKEIVEDIDTNLFNDFLKKANECGRIKENDEDIFSNLKKLDLITNNHLNNAGRVLFSKNKPLTLKLCVYASDEKLSFVDILRYEGNIFELSKKGQDYIKEHINYEAKIINDKRVEVPEIPLVAIREAVLNSLVHSSFSETINNEIYITPSVVSVFNPGAFPAGYDPDDFAFNGVESILRNPIISKVLYYSNDVDSWATGFRRIFKVCKENNVKVTYSKKNQGFEIVFHRRHSNITEDETLILNEITNNPNVTIKELANLTRKSLRTVQNIINSIKDKGLIEREGSKKSGKWIIKNL